MHTSNLALSFTPPKPILDHGPSFDYYHISSAAHDQLSPPSSKDFAKISVGYVGMSTSEYR